MKKKFLLVMSLCMFVSMAQAALLSNEPFDSDNYTVGDLDTQNPTVAGYTGAWTGTDWGDQHVHYSSGSLGGGTSGKASVPYNTDGGDITSGNSGRVYRSLDPALSADASTDGTLYLGFLFQSGQETGETVYQMLHLNQGTSGDSNRAFDIGITTDGDHDGTEYGFGVNNNYGSADSQDLGAADALVHLLVVKFELSSTQDSDSVTVWLDPTSETGGTTVSGVNLVWNSLMLSDYDGNSAAWDDIKWGTTFTDVLPGLINESPEYGDSDIPVERTASENDLVFRVFDPNIVVAEVYLEANDPNANVLIDTLTSVTPQQYTIDLESQLASDLAYDTPYYWKVIGYEPNAVSGLNDIPVYGPVWSFTTIPEDPMVTQDPTPAYIVVDAGEPNIVLTSDGINGDPQWYKDGSPLSDGADYGGTATKQLEIFDVQLADEGNYTVVYSSLIGSATSAPARVLTKRLTSHYPFETTSVVDGNDVTPDIVGGFDAVLLAEGGQAPPVLGDANSLVNKYLQLDNADYDTDPNGQYAQIPAGVVDYEDITISVWVHLKSTVMWQRILDFGNDMTSYMMLTPDIGSYWDARFAITTGGNSNEQRVTSDLDSENWIGAGSWHHVAVTISGDTGRMYVDGQYRAKNIGMTINPVDIGATLNYLGKSQHPWDPEFNGLIDELKIYNYVRTAEQIAYEYLTYADPTGWICDHENNDIWYYDYGRESEGVWIGGNNNCVLDLPDFAGMAVRWLEKDRFELP